MACLKGVGRSSCVGLDIYKVNITSPIVSMQ